MSIICLRERHVTFSFTDVAEVLAVFPKAQMPTADSAGPSRGRGRPPA